MSRKKKHSAPKNRGPAAAEAPMPASRSRLRPGARNLLYADLIFLAVSQLLSSAERLSETAAGACAIAGLVLLAVALWLQFRPENPKPKNPRL